jgi:uncharacterized RDD family membrane protein YckC
MTEWERPTPATNPTHPSGAVYATWLSRLGAELIDGFTVLLILRIIAAVVPEAFNIVAIGGGFLYNGMLDGGPHGQTLGKRALRIRVIDDATGELIGVQRGFMRALPPLAFGILGLISLSTFSVAIVASMLDGLWPLWNGRRQTWHDMVAGSVVVRATPVDAS